MMVMQGCIIPHTIGRYSIFIFPFLIVFTSHVMSLLSKTHYDDFIFRIVLTKNRQYPVMNIVSPLSTKMELKLVKCGVIILLLFPLQPGQAF